MLRANLTALGGRGRELMEFLAGRGFSGPMVNDYLLPMAGAIFAPAASMPPAPEATGLEGRVVWLVDLFARLEERDRGGANGRVKRNARRVN